MRSPGNCSGISPASSTRWLPRLRIEQPQLPDCGPRLHRRADIAPCTWRSDCTCTCEAAGTAGAASSPRAAIDTMRHGAAHDHQQARTCTRGPRPSWSALQQAASAAASACARTGQVGGRQEHHGRDDARRGPGHACSTWRSTVEDENGGAGGARRRSSTTTSVRAGKQRPASCTTKHGSKLARKHVARSAREPVRSRDVRRLLRNLEPGDVAHIFESSPPRYRHVLWQLIEGLAGG
jgi:hypothetical protein